MTEGVQIENEVVRQPDEDIELASVASLSGTVTSGKAYVRATLFDPIRAGWRKFWRRKGAYNPF